MKVDASSISFFTRRRSMRMSCTIVLSIVLLASITGRSLAFVVPKDPFFGIPPQDENHYKTSSDTIKCKDGSGKFTKAQLNDDFCDCPDGTDEPGTSACPGGQFYCRNAGHTPVFLLSSRVNDGICDCCDGSDEYDGQVKCPNTCWEAGKVARDRLQKKIATYKEGVTLRKKEIEQAKIAIAKEEAELSKLKNEEKILKGLVQQLKERKEQIEKAEEKERLQKEKEEKERKEAEEKANSGKSVVEEEAKQEKGQTGEKIGHEDKHVESTNHDVIGITDDFPADQKGQEDEEPTTPKIKDDSEGVSKADHDAGTEVTHDQTIAGSDEAINAEELSREELGRLVASRWTGNSEKQTEENGDTKDNEHEDDEKITHSTHDDEYDHYASETDDDSGKYDDVDVEDDVDETYEEDAHHDDETYEEDVHHDSTTSDTSDFDDEVEFSWLDKIQRTVRNILQAVNFFQTPVDKSEAARVRKEYDESSAKLSKMQSRISSLTQKLKHDFGTEKEFYSFYDRCFESKQNKYVYKVCPFKQASQVEGHSTTRLGRWDKFEDSYQVMIFSSGDKCWNGPDRSLKVKQRCGLKNEVTDVDEPSRCEYVSLLSTPALCLEEKLKELEDKLASMNKEQPQSHDEL